MTISTEYLIYNKESKTFSGYASDIQLESIDLQYVIYNPKTQMSQYFTQTHTDRDGSGEDIYGWNYKSHQGIKLLIIND